MDETVFLKQLKYSTGEEAEDDLKLNVTNTDRTFGTIFGCRDHQDSIGNTLEEDTYHDSSATAPADRASVPLFQRD